jgi:hypothetical protein
MNKNVSLIILTSIMLSVAIYGKWIEKKIAENARAIVEDRLKPQPWLSKAFDYYGTPIEANFVNKEFLVDKLKENIDYIKDWRKSRDSVWSAYLATEMVPEEQKLIDKINEDTKDVDAIIDDIIQDVENDKNSEEVTSIIKSGVIEKKITPIMDNINLLINLQSSEGEKLANETKVIMYTFSNFMIGVLSLSFILLGTLVYDFIKTKREATKPVRKTRKPATKKPVKRTTTKKK